MHDSTQPQDDPLEDLLTEYLDLLRAGNLRRAEELLEASGDRAAEVRRRVETLHAMGLLEDDSDDEQVFGRYITTRTLGSGGMGVVYEAFDQTTERTVALKVLSPHLLASPEALARFEREAQAIARLRHPRVVPVYDVGRDRDGRPYFVMEKIEGQTLADWIAESSKSSSSAISTWRSVVRQVLEIADAVSDFHALGILHRDLKPSNVLLDEQGHAVLFDLGLALQEGVDGDTRTGGFVGTPLYAAPEVLLGAPASSQSETFLLGSTLFEALTFKRLRRESSDAQLATSSRSIREVTTDYPRDLDAVVRRATDPNPDRRYETVREFADDLERALRGEATLARPPSPWRRARDLARRYPRFRNATSAVLLTLTLVWIATSVALRQAIAAEERWEHSRASVQALTAEQAQLADELAFQNREIDVAADIETLRRLAANRSQLGPLLPPFREPRRTWCRDAEAALDSEGHSAFLVELEDRVRGRLGLGRDDPLDWANAARIERWLRTVVLEYMAEADALGEQIAEVLEQVRVIDDIEQRTLIEPATLWQEVCEDIALHPDYDGLELEPMYGLIPLGEDPTSALFEFWDVRTGSEPSWSPERGHRVQSEREGTIFVLVPGGEFLMGENPDFPWIDDIQIEINGVSPTRLEPSSEQFDVELEPFLLSKYELTNAQVESLLGIESPDVTPAGSVSGRHPTWTDSWHAARALLHSFGLDHPTEAQWEYAARAGGWFEFVEDSHGHSLEGVANLRDARAINDPQLADDRWTFDRWLDDRATRTAEVGQYEPNPFGFFDLQGNLSEWCLDAWGGGPPLSGDGRRHDGDTERRVVRGTNFRSLARHAWSTGRAWADPNTGRTHGVRPARNLSQ